MREVADLAGVGSEHHAMVSAGVIPLLVRLLKSWNPNLQVGPLGGALPQSHAFHSEHNSFSIHIAG